MAQKINTKIDLNNNSFNYSALDEELKKKNATNQISENSKIGYGIMDLKIHDWIRGL